MPQRVALQQLVAGVLDAVRIEIVPFLQHLIVAGVVVAIDEEERLSTINYLTDARAVVVVLVLAGGIDDGIAIVVDLNVAD